MIRTSNWTSQPWQNVSLSDRNPSSIGYGLTTAFVMNTPANRVINLAQIFDAPLLAGTTKPTWDSSPYGNCLTFDGSSGYISAIAGIGKLDFLVSTAVFTIAWRMKFTTVSADALYTIIGGDLSSTNKLCSIWFENRVSQSSPKSLRMLVGRGVVSSPSINYQSAVNAIADTNWHHVAITANASSAIAYVDGIPLTASVNTSSGAPSGPLTSVPNIGATVTPSFFFGGQMEHFFIWNRVLTAEEVIGMCTDPYQIFSTPVLPQIFGYVSGARSLFVPPTLSLGCGGPFFQTPVNG